MRRRAESAGTFGAHVARGEREQRSRLFRQYTRSMIAAAVVGGCVVVWAAPAAAYRPFDGTDAAVADLGELEIEFQPAGVIHPTTTTALAGPNAVFNYGFAKGWELVLQAARPFPEDAGPSNVPNASLVKYVVQPGALQDKPGPSVATEFGLLYSDFGVPGTVGFSWSGIVSQRWDWGTVHINFDANRTPDEHPELFIDTIIEGPIKWKVRPVAEIYADSGRPIADLFGPGRRDLAGQRQAFVRRRRALRPGEWPAGQ